MWQAKFSNGEVLNEVDAENHEVLFSEVLKRSDTLESLSIILEDKIFTVRMTDGRFSISINGDVNHFFAVDAATTSLSNIRPIYFVREVVYLMTRADTGLSQSSSPNINFTALGFQANFEGRNVKRYLAIFPNGTFVIKDK